MPVSPSRFERFRIYFISSNGMFGDRYHGNELANLYKDYILFQIGSDTMNWNHFRIFEIDFMSVSYISFSTNVQFQ